jgi:hypothetical protein
MAFDYLEANECPCNGSGWGWQGDWIECNIHYHGQLHPESKELLLDDPSALKEEERKSLLKWKIARQEEEVTTIQQHLLLAQQALYIMNLELINKTPTVKMAAVNQTDQLEIEIL